MKINWATIADPSNMHGYSVIASRFREAMGKCGAEIVSPRSWEWDLAVTFALPLSWMLATGKDTRADKVIRRISRDWYDSRKIRRDMVYHTMYECTPLPQNWVDVLNRAGLVWVPSRFCKTLFEDAGVKRPIMVAGYGVNQTDFSYVERNNHNGPFKFIVWNRGVVTRKNLIGSVKAFIKAGLPEKDCVLEIKVNAGFGTPDFLWKGEDGITRSVPNVRFADSADWTTSQLYEWFASADAMIYASRGEGFGLMPLEAGSTGLPVICSYNTGMMDYLSTENSYPIISHTFEKSVDYSARFGGTAYWLEPSIEEMTEKIKYVYYHRDEALEKGKVFAEMAKQMTWEKAAEKALLQMKHYVS